MRCIYILLALALLGCTIPDDRRAAFVKNNPNLDVQIRMRILGGKISVGMTAEQVRASWGPPHSINQYSRGSTEQWVYGYLDYYYNFVPRHFVYFENGRVVDWQALGA